MRTTDKDKFSKAARKKMIDLGLNFTELGSDIGHARETVSKAVRTNKFPNVRRKVAARLNLKLSQL